MPEFDTYLSPFTWRYGSSQMRAIWSEKHKRLLWRQIWVALAEIEAQFGLVTSAQLADLIAHQDQIDLEKALAIEQEIHHDLMAEVKTYASQCPVGGGILHLGATSMDIEDNADALRIRESLDLILETLRAVLLTLADPIEKWANVPVMAFTHLQPAEPTTLGYRLAFTAQDLLEDFQALSIARTQLRGKGFKGAVGTSAAYADLIPSERLAEFEDRLSQRLKLPFFPITHQTYPRKQDYRILSALAGLAATLSKFAFDVRVLQSPPFGEWSEPFGKDQVGSSAMPFKRNPINAEKINSLARALAQMPRIAWDNAANSLLERTLDDSANRRTLLPEAFLTADELLNTSLKIIRGLRVDKYAVEHNLALYGTFAATEKIMMEAVKAGADRQEMHALLRSITLNAWDALRQGEANPLEDLLLTNVHIAQYLSPQQIRTFLNPQEHLGLAPQKAMAAAHQVRNSMAASTEKHS